MRKRSDIHTFEDEEFLKRMTRDSAVTFVVGVAAVLVMGVALAMIVPDRFDGLLLGIFAGGGHGIVDYLLWMAWVVAAVVVSLAAHELVHGLLFKVLAPAGARVTFGANWRKGMLYASAEGIVYTRAQYTAIALAPTVVVTLLVVAAGFACGCPVAGAFAAVLHLTGCTGDWGYVRALRADPLITHCEDTSYGVCFYGEGEGSGAHGAAAFGGVSGGDACDGDAPGGGPVREDLASSAGEVRP